MLTFDAETHRYYWMGKHVPNVTSILHLIIDLSKIKFDVLEAARLEGNDMHRMVELEVGGDLDEAALPEWLRPRLAAFRRFRSETGFDPSLSEHRVYHRKHGYAGTLDLVGRMRVPAGRTTAHQPVLIDLKRSFAAGRAIGLQTAAYANALMSEGWDPIHHRVALRLLADGSYRLEPFDAPTDFAHFLSVFTAFKLKESLT